MAPHLSMIVEILDSDDNPVPYEDVDDDTGSMLRRTIRLPAGTNIKVSLLFPFSIDLHGAGGCIVTIGLGQSLDEPSRVQSVWYDAADLKGLESTRSYFLVWADESHDGETQTIQRYFTAPDAVPDSDDSSQLDHDIREGCITVSMTRGNINMSRVTEDTASSGISSTDPHPGAHNDLTRSPTIICKSWFDPLPGPDGSRQVLEIRNIGADYYNADTAANHFRSEDRSKWADGSEVAEEDPDVEKAEWASWLEYIMVHDRVLYEEINCTTEEQQTVAWVKRHNPDLYAIFFAREKGQDEEDRQIEQAMWLSKQTEQKELEARIDRICDTDEKDDPIDFDDSPDDEETDTDMSHDDEGSAGFAVEHSQGNSDEAAEWVGVVRIGQGPKGKSAAEEHKEPIEDKAQKSEEDKGRSSKKDQEEHSSAEDIEKRCRID